MMSMCPCSACKDRQLGCHDKCVKYLSWRKELDNHNAKVRQAKLYQGWDIPNKKTRQV